MIVYVVVYDEPDEPSDVCAVFDTREAADAYVECRYHVFVAECELQVGVE